MEVSPARLPNFGGGPSPLLTAPNRLRADYFRFIEQWTIAQAADAAFQGVPFPADRFELPSPELFAGDSSLAASSSLLGLPIVEEPPDGFDPGGGS